MFPWIFCVRVLVMERVGAKNRFPLLIRYLSQLKYRRLVLFGMMDAIHVKFSMDNPWGVLEECVLPKGLLCVKGTIITVDY